MFFLRILVVRWQRLVLIVAISTSTIFGVAYFFFAIFQCGFCKNIAVFNYRISEGRCANKFIGLAMNYTYAILTTISDWICGLLPIFILKDSNMPLRAKFVVGGLLAFAAL